MASPLISENLYNDLPNEAIMEYYRPRSDWKIRVRLSTSAGDITLEVPDKPPYITVGGLRKLLLEHVDHSYNIQWMHLGTHLDDSTLVVPVTEKDPQYNDACHIGNEGILQAMVRKVQPAEA
ncbi:hypothetical protein PHYBLDRAFT_157665 [Phycomyces blakesleeanus NRRL 1555(-)]|uniref:Ubiquitin-like domain-containing protein n=2 Tax=Phycomyces blakesleeanus TaxID=4837 RepID=A0A167Q104_PHYB8|nr:hypothetical protein PHYBLDRAFT_157665 [Phycomyces blakesleeanus NRRL 1555(-)]OAD78877.1 hypothetical protein PHYBLDRAFT_157665 [Phycomyces blakesleeanus NRRL 1555(-)]|eukprot:XP_018296917.1 hypothetical protein PHYBLDRAFT_157665 [Phycomyces blakesleeanus NRRL 1555(-)]